MPLEGVAWRLDSIEGKLYFVVKRSIQNEEGGPVAQVGGAGGMAAVTALVTTLGSILGV